MQLVGSFTHDFLPIYKLLKYTFQLKLVSEKDESLSSQKQEGKQAPSKWLGIQTENPATTDTLLAPFSSFLTLPLAILCPQNWEDNSWLLSLLLISCNHPM